MDRGLGIFGLSDDFRQSQRGTAMAYRFQNDKCMIETAKKVLAVDKSVGIICTFVLLFRYPDHWSIKSSKRLSPKLYRWNGNLVCAVIMRLRDFCMYSLFKSQLHLMRPERTAHFTKAFT